MKNKPLLFASVFILLFGTVVGLQAKSTLFNLIFDMFNQVSLKPQEAGSMTKFAIGAVSIDGREIEDPNDRFTRIVKDIISETATINPVKPTKKSLADGQFKFATYCAVCHGTTRAINEAGFAKTKINDVGMIAPAVITLTPFFNDGYIYQKAKYGGSIMPALGYVVNEQERWNIVNYIRKLEKQE
ncbi:MAG: cytochrome c [Desulfobacteraceae bacterium]|nr:cytochrome c [Desulfobacteraceae bacterium]